MSSSSEIVDSGRFSGEKLPEKSSFSQTCNLLSQYMKEKRSLGLTNGMPATSTTPLNLFPMNLFPQQAGFESPKKTQPKTAPMTIFYQGQVIVFNDFPADKAEEIMLLANKGKSHNPKASFVSNLVPKKATESTNLIAPGTSNVVPNFAKIQEKPVQRHPQPIVADLPIARKASLTRFLEKRKDRIISQAPYQTNKPTATSSNVDENKSWLGLAAQSPLQFRQ